MIQKLVSIAYDEKNISFPASLRSVAKKSEFPRCEIVILGVASKFILNINSRRVRKFITVPILHQFELLSTHMHMRQRDPVCFICGLKKKFFPHIARNEKVEKI